MLFNSISFLLFFPIVCIAYFATPFKFRWALLLGASYYFYMCWKPEYALLLALVTLVNYTGGMLIAKSENSKFRKGVLISSIVTSLAFLYYYKYFNFFGRSINSILDMLNLSMQVPLPHIILPVGISFFTFQALSYTIDVYKGNLKAEKHLGIFALFVSFFPQLVAGPIERATHLLPQFYEKHKFNGDMAIQGLRLMLWGFFKKIVIADRVSVYVDSVYNNHLHHSGLSYIVATILFAFQIYCDFSGYSDLARGSARIMGYRLMVNFRLPYLSVNVTKYWQNNHISLTTWLKDYVYFPLVEKKPTIFQMCKITFFTFLLSGLWHGADWTFVIWGIWQAAFLIFDILVRKRKKKIDKWLKKKKLIAIIDSLRIALTFVIISLGLVFFRAANISQATDILTGILTLKSGGLFKDAETLLYAFAGIMILLIVESKPELDFNQYMEKKMPALRWSAYIVIMVSIMVMGVFDASQFIYFQF